jgi:myo-inositol-1(or 4)-monophosphatase
VASRLSTRPQTRRTRERSLKDRDHSGPSHRRAGEDTRSWSNLNYPRSMSLLQEELLDLATRVAHEAGASVLEAAPDLRRAVATKSSLTDLVTQVDRSTEAMISSEILRLRPTDSIFGEEGASTVGTSGVRWVIDPIDGTVNYTYGMPGFCVSIAAEVDETVSVGVVFDPLSRETFTAARDLGSHLNGIRLSMQASGVPLESAVVGTGFDYRSKQRAAQAQVLARLLPAVGDIRRIGSAALELCWVACGRLDAYFERGVKPWDHAAASLIASEAGASVVVRDPDSKELDVLLVASRPELITGLLALIESPKTD